MSLTSCTYSILLTVRGWGVRPASQNPYPEKFQTKICDFTYPVSALIKNLIPYSDLSGQLQLKKPRSLARDRSVWQAIAACTWLEHNLRSTFVDGIINNDEEVASFKKHAQSRLKCTNHTLFQTKLAKIDTLFQTKTATFCKKPYPIITSCNNTCSIR